MDAFLYGYEMTGVARDEIEDVIEELPYDIEVTGSGAGEEGWNIDLETDSDLEDPTIISILSGVSELIGGNELELDVHRDERNTLFATIATTCEPNDLISRLVKRSDNGDYTVGLCGRLESTSSPGDLLDEGVTVRDYLMEQGFRYHLRILRQPEVTLIVGSTSSANLKKYLRSQLRFNLEQALKELD